MRIHGIINQGGQAANIIPDYTSAQFYVRAATRYELNPLTRRVIQIGKGAALQAGSYIQVINEKHALHTPEFRDLAMQNRAMEGMLLAARTMAWTACDVITNPRLLVQIKEEFALLKNRA